MLSRTLPPRDRIARIPVLLVEGDPSEAGRLRDLLEDDGGGRLSVRHAPSIEEAARSAPDAAVVLLGLSATIGPEGCGSLVDRAAGTPILVLVGPDELEAGARCLDRGARELLPRRGLPARALARHLERAVSASPRVQSADTAALARPETTRDEAADELMAGLSHELRSSLAFVQGFVDLLGKGRLRDEAAFRSFLDDVERQLGRLDGVAASLPELLRLVDDRLELDRSEVEIGSLVIEAAQSLAGAAEARGVTLRYERPETPLRVLGDRGHLHAAVAELVTNAVRFSPDGVAVEVEASVEEEAISVRVKDQGPGVAAEAIPGIFDLFYRAPPPSDRAGAGIGLYVARRIVELHGGSLRVESEPGEGSVFTVTLPALEPAGKRRRASGSEDRTAEPERPTEPAGVRGAAEDAPTEPASPGPPEAERSEPSPSPRAAEDGGGVGRLDVLWLGGASCDGCTMAVLGASEPGLEDLLLGGVSGAPPVTLIHPALSLESGAAYLEHLQRAAAGTLDAPFVLVLEGSVLDESLAGEGYFSRLGERDGRPITIDRWIDALAPRAAAVVAVGSCSAWGGIPAAAGTPTGAMGLDRYLGRDFASAGGIPVVNVPGCAPSGDAVIEAIVAVIHHLLGLVTLELDAERRPAWLYARTARPGPPRTDYLTSAVSRTDGGSEVGCPVPTQGWMRGVGGCSEVGGSCIGCTEPDFADRFLEAARPPAPPRA